VVSFTAVNIRKWAIKGSPDPGRVWDLLHGRTSGLA
jgi:hypothetical protein